MTMTQNKSENDMTPLNRVTIKASGIVVWQVASTSGHTYNVTVVRGHVSGCQDEQGQPCKSFQYRGHCHHASLVESRESERAASALLSSKVNRRIAQIDARIAQVTELGSCDTCGRMVKPGITTCARCLGY